MLAGIDAITFTDIMQHIYDILSGHPIVNADTQLIVFEYPGKPIVAHITVHYIPLLYYEEIEGDISWMILFTIMHS